MLEIVKLCERSSKIIKNISETISSIILGLVVIILFVQVLLRYLFKASIAGSDTLAVYSIIWVAMLACNALILEKNLIMVDFFDHLWPQSLKKIRKIMLDIIFLILLYILTIEGFKQAIDGLKITIPGLNPVPWFWAYLAIPIGAALMLCQYLSSIIIDIASTSNKGDLNK